MIRKPFLLCILLACLFSPSFTVNISDYIIVFLEGYISNLLQKIWRLCAIANAQTARPQYQLEAPKMMLNLTVWLKGFNCVLVQCSMGSRVWVQIKFIGSLVAVSQVWFFLSWFASAVAAVAAGSRQPLFTFLLPTAQSLKPPRTLNKLTLNRKRQIVCYRIFKYHIWYAQTI